MSNLEKRKKRSPDQESGDDWRSGRILACIGIAFSAAAPLSEFYNDVIEALRESGTPTGSMVLLPPSAIHLSWAVTITCIVLLIFVLGRERTRRRKIALERATKEAKDAALSEALQEMKAKYDRDVGDTSKFEVEVLKGIHWIIHNGRDSVALCWELVEGRKIQSVKQVRRRSFLLLKSSLEDVKHVFEKSLYDMDKCSVSLKYVDKDTGYLSTVERSGGARSRNESRKLLAPDHTAIRELTRRREEYQNVVVFNDIKTNYPYWESCLEDWSDHYNNLVAVPIQFRPDPAIRKNAFLWGDVDYLNDVPVDIIAYLLVDTKHVGFDRKKSIELMGVIADFYYMIASAFSRMERFIELQQAHENEVRQQYFDASLVHDTNDVVNEPEYSTEARSYPKTQRAKAWDKMMSQIDSFRRRLSD